MSFSKLYNCIGLGVGIGYASLLSVWLIATNTFVERTVEIDPIYVKYCSVQNNCKDKSCTCKWRKEYNLGLVVGDSLFAKISRFCDDKWRPYAYGDNDKLMVEKVELKK